MLIMCGGGKKNTSDKGEVDEMERGGGLTFRGMLSSQSGKLITLAALPTHSTTTVANICTHTFKRKSHKKKTPACFSRTGGGENAARRGGNAFNSLVQFRHILKKGTWRGTAEL